MGPNENKNLYTNRISDKKILVTPELILRRKYGNLHLILTYMFSILVAAIAIKAYTMDISEYVIIGIIVGTLMIAGIIVAIKNQKKSSAGDDGNCELMVTVEKLLFKNGGKGIRARNCVMEFESGNYRVMSEHVRDFHLSTQGDMFYLIHKGRQGNIIGAYNASYYKLCQELEANIIEK